MNESNFWEAIEAAWKKAGGFVEERHEIAVGSYSEESLEGVTGALDGMIEALRGKLSAMDKDDLLNFDRLLERKLYELDRSEIQEFTDGSDDGFLYARGFIVALGREYYEAVDANPSFAIMDAECEDLCYLSYHLYQESFGEMPESGITRESASNPAGWPEE